MSAVAQLGTGAKVEDHWPLLVKNDSGEAVPAYGLMRVTNADSVGGIMRFTIAKPNGTSGLHLVNSPMTIPVNGKGRGSNGNTALVLYDDADTPTFGESWGPASGSWKLTKDQAGWTIVGGAEDEKVEASRTSGAIADELRGQVQSYTPAGTSGNTYGIITLKTSSPAPIALPTGTPAISGTILVADVHLLGASYFSAGMIIRAVHNVGIDELGAAQVDWEHSPTGSGSPPRIVQVYHPTLANGEAVDPIHADLDRIFKGSLDGTDNIWIESINTPADDDVRSWLPADGYFIGIPAGNYIPSDHSEEEGISDEERPLYQVQPQHVGVVMAVITASNADSGADWSTMSGPSISEVTVDVYRTEEDGSFSVWKSDVTALWAVEGTATEGKIVYLGRMDGRYHVISELCAVASGYSE